MSGIRVENLFKSWGDNVAVNNISFEVEQASLTVLLGPSGCGKSTTLRLIAGLEQASGGRVIIGDKDVTDMPSANRNISMVFQSYALFPHLTIEENILFGLKVRKTGKAECARRLKKTAELLGLTDLLARRPSEISGGQQQRVALGRAIIAEKPVCLMDEPLSNLDAKLRHEMRIELRSLQQKLGITMVYVTHDQAEAISMADQIVLINKGQIEQIATPETIYRHPETAFTARFIGTPPMNIIKLDNIAGKLVISGSEIEVAKAMDDKPVLFGVRPEEILVVDTDGFDATVISGEYLGADTLLDCKLGDNTVTVRASGLNVPASGSTVQIKWQPQAQHFFDANSGRRREDLGGGT